MSDRELLMLAAKAAGIELWWTDNYGGVFLRQKHSPVIWNPLTKDEDALRMAVKLGMTVDIGSRPVAFTDASVIRDDMRIGADEYHEGDPYAATRRAIVRAAAEIGRTM